MDNEKNKKGRGKGFPGASLPECIDFAVKLEEDLGRGMPHDREAILRVMGYSPTSGAGNVKVGAMSHFGFLEASKGQYTLTENVAKIVRPCSDEEKKKEIKEAFFRPTLYNELIEAFSVSKQVPKELANILHRKFGISSGSCENAAKYFLESAWYAGVIDENNKIIPETSRPVFNEKQSESKNKNAEAEDYNPENREIENIADQDKSKVLHKIPLSNGYAVFQMPSVLTVSDFEKIKKVIELLELYVEAEDKSET
jgi:hypothetical protein